MMILIWISCEQWPCAYLCTRRTENVYAHSTFSELRDMPQLATPFAYCAGIDRGICSPLLGLHLLTPSRSNIFTSTAILYTTRNSRIYRTDLTRVCGPLAQSTTPRQSSVNFSLQQALGFVGGSIVPNVECAQTTPRCYKVPG